MLCAIFLLSACATKEPVKEEKKKVVSIPQPTLNTEDVSAVVMDADTGKVYYAKNEQESRYPASTIKLLSALVAGSLTVVSNFLLTKSLKTLIISMLLSFFIVKFVKINVLIWANVCYNRHRR